MNVQSLVRGLLEIAIFAGGLLVVFASAAGGQLLHMRWMDILAIGLFAALALVLLTRALIAFWRHRWIGGILRLFAVPVLLVVGGAGLFVTSMIADSLPEFWSQMQLTLPLEKGNTRRFVKEGERIAGMLSSKTPDGKPMKLRQVTFRFIPKGGEPVRTVEFDFSKDNFSCDATYQPEGHVWLKKNQHASGDTEMFKKNQKAIPAALPQQLQGSFDWAVNQAVADRLLEAGREMAKVLQQEQPLDSEGAAWNVESIEFHRGLAKGWHDSIQINLNAKREKRRVAWANVTLFFDGKQARFENCNGWVDDDKGCDFNMNHDAAVTSVLREWLSEDRGILKKTESHGKPWRSCEAALPGGVRIIYREQSAHAFLAEYNMRVEFLLPNGRRRCFDLPMNTGGRTKVLVYTGTTSSGSAAVRLVSGAYINIAFDLGTLRMLDPKTICDETYTGAFLGETTPLTWFPANR
jgi:hypothetical protein